MSLNDLFGLNGRVAVFAGGAGGIGAGICDVLADAGAKAIVADIAEAAARAKADNLRAHGFEAGDAALDLTDEVSLVAACAAIVAQYGTPWVLVNNAGLQDRELLLEGTKFLQWTADFLSVELNVLVKTPQRLHFTYKAKLFLLHCKLLPALAYTREGRGWHSRKINCWPGFVWHAAQQFPGLLMRRWGRTTP